MVELRPPKSSNLGGRQKYKMRIGHRTEGYACPFCSHHQTIPGNNSLAADYPELLAERDWDGIRVYTIFEQFPKGAELPFDEDCYGYASSARMNNAHLAIRDILKEIFAEYMDEIPNDLWDDDRWHEIARSAHLKLAKLL